MNTTQPMYQVSVIVPVYNVEKYLDQCLHSLVHQQLKSLEIIVVNDGSTDQSQAIIDAYSEQYPHVIKAFTKENGGLSDARNFGLSQAQGSYIGFVDSDDYVSDNMFQEMFELGAQSNADVVICNLQKVDEKGHVLQKLTQIPHLPQVFLLEENMAVFSDISYFACNKLFKKELFATNRFKKGVHFEDIQLIPQLFLESRVIAQTQSFHYQYLERADSISKTHTVKGLDILKAVDEVTKIFEQSSYKQYLYSLKNFQILEGVYSYLAYLAFVKEEGVYIEMSLALKRFMKENNINRKEILSYSRFGQNYLLSLPFRKKMYYLLFFFHQERLLRKIIK